MFEQGKIDGRVWLDYNAFDFPYFSQPEPVTTSQKPVKPIYINGRFLSQPLTGVQRYSYELLTALDDLVDSGEIEQTQFSLTCLVPENTPKQKTGLWKHIPIRKVGWMKGNPWEQIELPHFARGGLLVSLGNIGPYFHPNQVVTIHDASVFAYPRAYSFLFRTKYQIIIRRLGKLAHRILTVSQFSRDELITRCNIPPEKICVIPEGGDHILRCRADYGILQKAGISEKPFLFHVGSSSLHKNTQAIYQLAASGAIHGVEIVLAGGTYERIFQGQEKATPSRIRHLGYVSDGELRALYEKALALIFPSTYEGFGIPPLEAMTVGCPVICARTSSLPEVCGEAAIYFDPAVPGDLEAKVLRLFQEPGLREDIREKGYQQAGKFSWKRTAWETWMEISSM